MMEMIEIMLECYDGDDRENVMMEMIERMLCWRD